MERRDDFFQIKVLISFFSLGIIIARVVLPNLKMDAVALGLLIVAALPWFSELLQSAEFPGGWNYARFLNYCTERFFLRRVGRRYRFIHKLLEDYFSRMSC